jgi:hypothetical protein
MKKVPDLLHRKGSSTSASLKKPNRYRQLALSKTIRYNQGLEMNCFLLPIFVASFFMIGTAYGIPLTPEDTELNSPAMEYNYGYPMMEKRTASRPTLSDYLRLAAIQYEMDKEEDEAADAQNAAETLAEASPSVDKRGRRYGFWVTAINKMGGGNLKSFLGKHKNIYNVYKRNRAPMATGNVV